MSKIRVLVVDDSALIRRILASIIDAQEDMTCIGEACDPLQAREMIRALDPDVITLDVEMPHMDGLDFLERLMRLRPMPVVMISTLTETGADVTLRALELGAVDFVTKPQVGQIAGMNALADQVVEKLRAAARARVRRQAARPATAGVSASVSPQAPVARPLATVGAPSTRLICIGASTGGTEAIREILTHWPAQMPGIVITQHMPPRFTASFAQRLDSLCQLKVKEATPGETVLCGTVYIAPGGLHLSVQRRGRQFVTVISDSEPVNRHRPSVDVLMHSVAQAAGADAVGIMLTGMGGDGAQGLRAMKDSGSHNYAQDEASCVVYGMPREAVRKGGVHEVLPLERIAGAVVSHLQQAR